MTEREESMAAEAMKGARLPWSGVDPGAERISSVHTCDPPEAIATCCRCPRASCPGDCAERSRAASHAAPGGRTGARKNISMKDVVAAWEHRGGKSFVEIGRDLGVTKSTVRYWLLKAGVLK